MNNIQQIAHLFMYKFFLIGQMVTSLPSAVSIINLWCYLVKVTQLSRMRNRFQGERSPVSLVAKHLLISFLIFSKATFLGGLFNRKTYRKDVRAMSEDVLLTVT